MRLEIELLSNKNKDLAKEVQNYEKEIKEKEEGLLAAKSVTLDLCSK